MFLLPAGQPRLSVGMVTPEQRGRLGQGPLEGRVAAVLARGPQAFASGGLAAVDHARGRGTILYAGKAADVLDGIALPAAEALTTTGHRGDRS
jgi:hypothetical protein